MTSSHVSDEVQQAHIYETAAQELNKLLRSWQNTVPDKKSLPGVRKVWVFFQTSKKKMIPFDGLKLHY